MRHTTALKGRYYLPTEAQQAEAIRMLPDWRQKINLRGGQKSSPSHLTSDQGDGNITTVTPMLSTTQHISTTGTVGRQAAKTVGVTASADAVGRSTDGRLPINHGLRLECPPKDSNLRGMFEPETDLSIDLIRSQRALLDALERLISGGSCDDRTT